MKSFLNHVIARCSGHECAASGLAAVWVDKFQREREEDVKNYSFHWWLNKRQREAFNAALGKPLHSFTYFCFDFQVRG